MKVFVSWSGEVSLSVAKALKSWLPNVIQAVDVFVSSEDIGKGKEWFGELSSTLDTCDFGILCLTRRNLSAPWILYEAGALAKRFETARVTPVLVDIKMTDLSGPLAHFNGALLDREEIEKLTIAVNEQLGASKLAKEKLASAFDAFWPKLEKSLQLIAAQAALDDYRYDVFLSTPMAAYKTDAAYQAARTQFKKVFDALKTESGLSVYWAAEKIEQMSDFDTVDISVLDDLKALPLSRRFVLIYPQEIATSALFEAGYALALNRPCHYFVRDRDHLPFLMRELAVSNPNVRVHAEQDWKDYDDLADKLVKYKDKWFGR